MAIEFTKKADVAQRTEQGSSKAKVAGSSPAVSANESIPALNLKIKAEVLRSRGKSNSLHDINQAAEYMEKAAYDLDCKAPNDEEMRELIAWRVMNEKRLAYNAAYQRDLRTIKRLGLNCTVKEWREKNDPTSV